MGCIQGKVSIYSFSVMWENMLGSIKKEKMRKDKLGINYRCPGIVGLIVDVKESVIC